jgi:hypothetical protein
MRIFQEGKLINRAMSWKILLRAIEGWESALNPLTPNDLQRRRAVSLLKIKIPSSNMREKPANTPIIHSVY